MTAPAPAAAADFRFRRAGRWRCHLHAALATLPLAADAHAETPIEAALTDREHVPASRAVTLYRAQLRWAGETRPVFVKRFHARSRFDRIQQLVRRSRSERAFAADRLLGHHGFATPQTLLTGWRQRGPCRDGFFTVTAALTGYDGVDHLLRRLTGTAPGRKRELLLALAATVAALHRSGIAHGDLRLGNVMATPDPTAAGHWRFAFLDNERTRRRTPLPAALRKKNLVQLNMLTGPALTRSDRLRFFRAYCAADAGVFDAVWLRREVLARTRARLLRLIALGRLAPTELWL